jgi:HAE1 family hydrophobic/amphiphilic exporter-1
MSQSSQLPRSFFTFTVTRPVAITMVTLAVCVFGLFGLLALPVNLLPDIAYPTITVRTEYTGASPRDVEERVSERVQELVAVVPGIRRLYSVSRPGISDVVLEFGWGTRMDAAASDVRERLDRYFPPAGAQRPLVLRYDPSLDPVLTLGLVPTDSRANMAEVRRYAERELKPKLAQLPGAAAVKVSGGDEEEIRIALDEQALTGKGLDVATVTARLTADNRNAASGAIEESRTEYLVRLLNEYRSLEQIEDTILVDREGSPIKLREVAKVTRVAQDPQVIGRIGGTPCVLVDLQKAADTNIVDLCRHVRERTFGTEAQQRFVADGRHLQPLPPAADTDPLLRQRLKAEREQMKDYFGFEMQQRGMRVELLADQSRFIRDAIDEVRGNAVEGGLFAVLIIYFFLRSYFATFVLAIAIPLSLLATFAPMRMSGVDLNIMSLGGLALGVGMLVDNSIVVLEAIQKGREAGEDKRTAAVLGTRRIAGAVIASTITAVCVFFPIVFVEGLAGQLFRDQSLAVVFSLSMSLPVALFVVPMLVSRDRAPADESAPEVRNPLFRAVFALATWCARGAVLACRGVGALLALVLTPPAAAWQKGYGALDRAYPRVLRAALRHPAVVLLSATVLLAAAVFAGRGLGQELLPQVHQGEFWLEVFLPRSATVRATDEVVRNLEQRIRALPEVQRTFVASGVDPDELNSSERGKHSSRMQVTLRPDADRERQENRVRSAIEALVHEEPAIQNHRISSTSVLQFNANVVVEVIGHDLTSLRRACEQVAEAMARVPGLRDVRSTLQRGNPELTVQLDREQLSALGLDAETTARILRTKVQGEVPTLYAERERKIDIHVRIDRAELDSEERLRQVNVNPQGYPEIPLAAVAEIVRSEGPSEIRRLGNVRGAEVQASLAGFDLGRAQLQVRSAIDGLALPRGIEARLGGQKEELERSNQSLTTALWLAVFLVYVVMAAQFESIVQPLIILVSVPLAIIGVVMALRLTGTDVSVIVFLGGIVLAGIVVNNAIILIDQINQLRAQGRPLREAVVDGAHSRLRPVLMTKLTAMLGLLPQTGWLSGLPLIGGRSEGLELRAPMAVTVIGGLTSSTLLTLVLVPVIYSLVARRSRRVEVPA